jgi:hypothetical protein
MSRRHHRGGALMQLQLWKRKYFDAVLMRAPALAQAWNTPAAPR